MPPRAAVAKRSAATKMKAAADGPAPPLFDVEVEGKRFKVYTGLITWQHEAILKSQSQPFEPGGFTVRKLDAQLGTNEYTQMTLAGIIQLARLQAGENVTFIEVANEVGGGYEDNLVWNPDAVKAAEKKATEEAGAPVDESEDDDLGEAPGGAS